MSTSRGQTYPISRQRIADCVHTMWDEGLQYDDANKVLARLIAEVSSFALPVNVPQHCSILTNICSCACVSLRVCMCVYLCVYDTLGRVRIVSDECMYIRMHIHNCSSLFNLCSCMSL